MVIVFEVSSILHVIFAWNDYFDHVYWWIVILLTLYYPISCLWKTPIEEKPTEEPEKSTEEAEKPTEEAEKPAEAEATEEPQKEETEKTEEAEESESPSKRKDAPNPAEEQDDGKKQKTDETTEEAPVETKNVEDATATESSAPVAAEQ